MKIYWITTRNGTFIAVGNDEKEAKINFTIEFPSEKIREIEQIKSKAVQVSQLIS